MILTITPNPALDVTGNVDDVVPNEKTYVMDERRFPGGNGINAARIISTLGVNTLATGFLAGAVGDEIAALLDEENVPHDFVRIKGSTRVNVTVSKRQTYEQTRLSFPGPKVARNDVQRLCDKVTACSHATLLNLGGSFPPGFTIDDIRAIASIAARARIGMIVDIPSRHLGEVLQMYPLLVKPNLSEFNELVSKQVESVSDVRVAAATFTKYTPIFCVSSVEDGVLLLTSNTAWHAKGPRVSVRSTVGAGDAMVGAMSARLNSLKINTNEGAASISDEAVVDILTWGLSAALATIVTPGTGLGSAEGIDQYIRSIKVVKI